MRPALERDGPSLNRWRGAPIQDRAVIDAGSTPVAVGSTCPPTNSTCRAMFRA
jgi:hypothetical protein